MLARYSHTQRQIVRIESRQLNPAPGTMPTCMQEFPQLSKSGLSLLNGLLTYDPDKRLTARQAVKHDYFTEAPFPKLPQDMPVFPSAHDADANDDQHKK